eukprot:TRINITY_DN17604_c3_g1_i1.p1 TRINITY_DN17604_c3_g1~~TRINITY_DN17604_c3_g1_i1.p1  ORF type:complete len:605 (+),score=167.88 TRINITY_DN17604_c3_g1_i1:85-1899(+)
MATLGDKFKKLIGRSSPIMDMVEDATSELLLNPAWEKNMAVCDVINRKLDSAKEVLVCIKKRAGNSSPKVQYLTLVLLETCIKNAGKRFINELCQHANLRDEIIKVALKTGSADHLMAADQAKRILVNFRTFAPAAVQAQQPSWQAIGQQRGVGFHGIPTDEDWSSQVGSGEDIASNPRNYHQEEIAQARVARGPMNPANPNEDEIEQQRQILAQIQEQNRRRQQQQQHHHAHHHQHPSQRPPDQPMIVTGPDGRQMLVQPIAPGTAVRGAVHAPPAMNQAIVQLSQQVNQQNYPYQHHHHHHHHHHHQHHQQRHVDPAVREQQIRAAQEQQESKLAEDLSNVPYLVSLMKEMLDTAGEENRAPEEVRGDEVISQLAENLRSIQGRVSHVLENGGGSENLEMLLTHNDSLVDILERYATVSGGVGIPQDPGLVMPPNSRGQSPSAAAAQQQQMQILQQLEAQRRAQEPEPMPMPQHEPEEPIPAPAAAQTLDDIFSMPASAPTAPTGETEMRETMTSHQAGFNLQEASAESLTYSDEYVPPAPAAEEPTPAPAPAPSPPKETEETNPFLDRPASPGNPLARLQPQEQADLDFDSFLNDRMQPVS